MKCKYEMTKAGIGTECSGGKLFVLINKNTPSGGGGVALADVFPL